VQEELSRCSGERVLTWPKLGYAQNAGGWRGGDYFHHALLVDHVTSHGINSTFDQNHGSSADDHDKAVRIARSYVRDREVQDQLTIQTP
jgi:hypothetical protein